jgi:hypothetical protein
MTVVKKTTVGIVCAMTTLAAVGGETWKFDRLDEIGGHKTTLLGHPRVIDTPRGKAIEFKLTRGRSSSGPIRAARRNSGSSTSRKMAPTIACSSKSV